MGDSALGYTRPYNWTNDAAQGIGISYGEFDADGNQVAAALNNRLRLDGQASNLTADVPCGGKFTFTGLRQGAAAGEAATFDQVKAVQAAGDFAFCLAVFGL